MLFNVFLRNFLLIFLFSSVNSCLFSAIMSAKIYTNSDTKILILGESETSDKESSGLKTLAEEEQKMGHECIIVKTGEEIDSLSEIVKKTKIVVLMCPPDTVPKASAVLESNGFEMFKEFQVRCASPIFIAKGAFNIDYPLNTYELDRVLSTFKNCLSSTSSSSS